MDSYEHFHLAEINQDGEVTKMLTEFENKLGERIGGDIVLIAYKHNKEEDAWH